MELIQGSETSANYNLTPGKYPEENIQLSDNHKLNKIYKYLSFYAFFWIIARRLKFICRSFGTLRLFHLHRQVNVCKFYAQVPAYKDGTECSETSAYKIQTPGNYPEESIEHSEQGESLKSRNDFRLKFSCFEEDAVVCELFTNLSTDEYY